MSSLAGSNDYNPTKLALKHVRKDCTQSVGCAGEVDVDDVLPIFIRHLGQRAVDLDGSVRHCDIELVEFLDRAINRAAQRQHIADIGFDADPAAFLALNHFAGFIELLWRGWRINEIWRGDGANVESHDVSAGTSKRNANRAADSTRCTGHERRFSLQTEGDVWRLVSDVGLFRGRHGARYR